VGSSERFEEPVRFQGPALGVIWCRFPAESHVKRKAKPRTEKLNSSGVLIAFAVAFFVLLLLLRMMVFVAGHGRHHF
jgi:hypothetical protein